jgi:predicted aspartyl protease
VPDAAVEDTEEVKEDQ